MTTTVFEAMGVDYPTPEQAIEVIEKRGHGSVIRFFLERNREGCKPDYVHKSCGLWSFDGTDWWSHYIYSGTGEKLEKQKPQF